MFDALSDLPDGAAQIAVILGAVSAFTPFLNRLKAVEKITFTHPNLFGFTGSLAALGAYINASFVLRDKLHHMPGVASCFVVAILSLALLGGLAVSLKDEQPEPIHILAGLPLYALVAASIFFGITKFAAEEHFYWRIDGAVTQGENRIDGQEVSLYDAGNELIARTKTNSLGRYQFLLTGTVAERVALVYAGEDPPPDYTDRSWEVVEWDIETTTKTMQNLKVPEQNSEEIQ